jgi:hypothetical protein
MPYKSRKKARSYWRRYQRERRRRTREEREARERLDREPTEQPGAIEFQVGPLKQDVIQENPAGAEVEPTIRDVFPHKLNKLLEEVDDPAKKSKVPRMKPDPAGRWGWMK